MPIKITLWKSYSYISRSLIIQVCRISSKCHSPAKDVLPVLRIEIGNLCESGWCRWQYCTILAAGDGRAGEEMGVEEEGNVGKFQNQESMIEIV